MDAQLLALTTLTSITVTIIFGTFGAYRTPSFSSTVSLLAFVVYIRVVR